MITLCSKLKAFLCRSSCDG